MDENTRYKKVNKATARRYGKRVLAVRAMAGETAWLDGRIVWLDGRVAWESDRDTVIPSVAMLALAQRRLGQIKSYPRSASRAFGDASGWLAARRDRLELAKRLQIISEPDIPGLAEKAQKDERALARLLALLPAEAYCLNALPASPGEAVVACGGMAATVLREMADDEEAPQAGRALAAMALGAIRKRSIGDDEQKITRPRWNARAYAWGVKHGWSTDAPLVVSLLAEDDGNALAERLARVERDGNRFLLPVEDLRGLLARGIDAGRVVELCEACAAMEPVAVRLMHYRDKLEGVSLHWRREVAAQLQNERLAWVADLIELVCKYALGDD